MAGGSMTAQLNDTVLYQGKELCISGVKGEGLFNPEDHGLRTMDLCSACHRGSVCKYEIAGDRLMLKQVDAFLDEEQEESARRGDGPLLLGKAPDEKPGPIDTIVYSDLGTPLEFTGGLLLTSGFIKELYVHMGFHPAWKYREARELTFEGGLLTHVTDLSTLMARFRELVKGEPLRPGLRAARAEIEKWVEDCFSLKY
jgi:hypothetical protein